MIKIHSNQEEGVSPVVGVMLMLVVTIIIAAVVSAYAGHIGGNTEVPPQTSIDVQITTSGGPQGDQIVMTFEHLSGDPIPTADMKILTFYKLPGGETVASEVTDEDPAVRIFSTDDAVKLPYLNDISKGVPGESPKVDFGNFTFQSGDIMSSGTTIGTGVTEGGFMSGDAGMIGCDLTDSANGFERGSPVEVKIVHIPSDKVLFSKEVIAV
ncbi:flagellin-like protein [Methanofollis sp. W23]|uniref:type IV pilin N-terminal domain-containing protein n=1 Tax=Methanofollis sp. W23 TaxID=2817849 RepID=UPI001DF2454A|nr:type IV pilin N-terminal domain-containing protein [Methanofollis sp. W23]MBP2145335.1 flagellin-like protein [Methanofollis sp. W23]